LSKSRIIYQNWIVELGRDPSLNWHEASNRDGSYNQKIVRTIHKSLDKLTEGEAGFIRLFYFQGMSYREISELTGREIYRLEGVHTRAIRKLRNYLKVLVDSHDLAGSIDSNKRCPVCCHKDKNEINRLIENKQPDETWKHLVKILQEKFGLRISTPQILIGHQRYHMTGKEP